MPRSSLGQAQPLAEGGQALIYRLPAFSLPGEGRLVYKEYRPKTLASAGPALLPGLLSLVRFRDRLGTEERARLDLRAIWPLRVVTGDAGHAVGIVMREIPAEFFDGGNVREIQRLFNADADSRAKGWPAIDLPTRLLLLTRLAEAYHLLHTHHDIVIGDVNHGNVAFTAGSQPRVIVLDTDSARKTGGQGAFGKQPHTMGWEPPETMFARRKYDHLKRSGTALPGQLSQLSDAWSLQSKGTDVYKFGLMVVRILDYGRQRSQNRKPDKARQILLARLGGKTGSLLDRTLSDDPKARPTMEEWYQAFRGRTGAATSHRDRPQARPAARGQSAPRPPQRVGNWRWVEGTGWVRDASTPAKGGTP